MQIVGCEEGGGGYLWRPIPRLSRRLRVSAPACGEL